MALQGETVQDTNSDRLKEIRKVKDKQPLWRAPQATHTSLLSDADAKGCTTHNLSLWFHLSDSGDYLCIHPASHLVHQHSLVHSDCGRKGLCEGLTGRLNLAAEHDHQITLSCGWPGCIWKSQLEQFFHRQENKLRLSRLAIPKVV